MDFKVRANQTNCMFLLCICVVDRRFFGHVPMLLDLAVRYPELRKLFMKIPLFHACVAAIELFFQCFRTCINLNHPQWKDVVNSVALYDKMNSEGNMYAGAQHTFKAMKKLAHCFREVILPKYRAFGDVPRILMTLVTWFDESQTVTDDEIVVVLTYSFVYWIVFCEMSDLTGGRPLKKKQIDKIGMQTTHVLVKKDSFSFTLKYAIKVSVYFKVSTTVICLV